MPPFCNCYRAVDILKVLLSWCVSLRHQPFDHRLCAPYCAITALDWSKIWKLLFGGRIDASDSFARKHHRVWRICSIGRTVWPPMDPRSATSPGALVALQQTSPSTLLPRCRIWCAPALARMLSYGPRSSSVHSNRWRPSDDAGALQ